MGRRVDFVIEGAELEKLEAWNELHLKAEHPEGDTRFGGGKEPYTGAIGGRLGYTFIPTGLGVIVKAYCGLCYRKDPKPETAECDLTDYDSW